MAIYINNSLSRKKEEFTPLNPPQVNIYTCGVTVYGESHIGHARSLYIFDVIRKYLEYRGYKVNFVRNITDIDDKIINKAKELGVTAKEVAEKYTNSYYEDIKALGINKADSEPKATDNIDGMIKHIQGLIDKGFAYESKGDVYFIVRKFKDYGKLSGQNLEQMLAGTRIEKDGNKKDPLDFALWKKFKEGEPKWSSPWGEGRPGWHIECSVMSQRFLKTDTLDIHAGGCDLIFPHHENEIAQSESLTGKQFAKYWIHHGLLTIHAQKMAKSLGNFITIKDFIAKYRDVDILKLFFLSAHYSQPIDFTEEKMQESRKQRFSFNDFFDRVNNWPMLKEKTQIDFSEKDKESIDNFCVKFQESMDNDFNTPQALARLFELMDLSKRFVSSDKKEAFSYAKFKIEKFFGILGLRVKTKEEVDEKIKELIQERDLAKQKKDFKKADSIREKIEKDFGYFVSDTSTNVTITKIEK
ncbi:MAG: cysteine--tRNA ligase [Candidatus Omnitrophota bacterium]